MEDLEDLIWGPNKPQTQTIASKSLNDLKATPKLSTTSSSTTTTSTSATLPIFKTVCSTPSTKPTHRSTNSIIDQFDLLLGNSNKSNPPLPSVDSANNLINQIISHNLPPKNHNTSNNNGTNQRDIDLLTNNPTNISSIPISYSENNDLLDLGIPCNPVIISDKPPPKPPRSRKPPLPSRSTKPNIDLLSASKQLKNSETNKTKGNGFFKLGQFGEAENHYSLAINSLPSNHLLRVVLHNNRAAARLKNGNHHGCVEDCSLAIELIDDYMLPLPPDIDINIKDQYTKALLRRASAYEAMEKYDFAKHDYQKIIYVDPNVGKNINEGLRRCQKAIKMMYNDNFSTSSISNNDNNNSLNMRTTTTTQPLSFSSSTFGVPLNAYGFIDPIVEQKTMMQPIDPNNPAVMRLRDKAQKQEWEEVEKLRLKDQVDKKLLLWKSGKESNIRALISSLDLILWHDLDWKKIGLHELVTPSQVKIKYMKAISKLHPDKLNHSTTTIEQRLIANGVFSVLNDAWDTFKIQNNL
nr:1263_t:CDS:2 [Entrophospora candida]CAG8526730.1 899_t:CDS:2 [Entrophospora candida]